MPLLQEEKAAWSSRETLLLAGLLMAALAVRLPHLMAPYVINPDAVDYISSAKALALGKWREGFRASHVSIFPVLIALVQPFSGDWVWTARGISVLFGLITVTPLYLVARKLLGWPWAALPPLLYCLCPALTSYSMEVVREPISWFILFAGLWALLRAQESGRPLWFLLAGAVFLLGAANRLDGLMALAVALAWLLGTGLSKRTLIGAIKRASLLMIPSAVALSVALILFGGALMQQDLLEVRNYKKQIQLSLQRPSQTQDERINAILEGIAQPRLRSFFSSAWENRHALAGLELLKHWIKAGHPALLGLSLLGFFALGRWKGREVWWLLALLILAWLALGYVRLSGAFAISKRHLGPAVLSGYFFVPLGISQACGWALKKGWTRSARSLTLVVICFLVVLTLPWTLRPQRQDKLVRRFAGEWIEAQGIPKPLVATQHQIVAFYSGGSWLPLKDLLRDSIAAADFLVVEKDSPLLKEVLEALGRKGVRVELRHEVSYPQNPTLLIYLLKSSPSPSGFTGSIGGGPSPLENPEELGQ